MSNDIFDRLAKSKFRSSFHLKEKDILYIKEKGLDKIKSHAYDFVNKRLKDVSNLVDGKQTPMRGHPVFVAQHATGCCCRGCLEKWYKVKKGVPLTKLQQEKIVELLLDWCEQDILESGKEE